MPRTFAIKLAAAPTKLSPQKSQPVTLKYDLAVATTDGAKSSAAFSLPAEMLPASVNYVGVQFKLAPSDKANAIVAKGQSISLAAENSTAHISSPRRPMAIRRRPSALATTPSTSTSRIGEATSASGTTGHGNRKPPSFPHSPAQPTSVRALASNRLANSPASLPDSSNAPTSPGSPRIITMPTAPTRSIATRICSPMRSIACRRQDDCSFRITTRSPHSGRDGRGRAARAQHPAQALYDTLRK